ncbi:MAG: hypothetical protein EOP51_23430 [Sphingobacteriales bacterium]|nr:MAG: hypothetical protein EOP51_23430 [Sphingobacteriales bacterium]
MILNETPGVYATQQGGGSGDSRISIRGFDQRNVAVMINGVPVNDMENGAVFWSNWDLGDVTRQVQVQRGLSASKLAQPSVGGTINIITKGFGAERSGRIRQEVGNNGYRKTSMMLSTGTLKGDWAVTVYGSRRVADGWVDMAFDDAWTYFGTISKRIGKHKIALTAMGSPQVHGQRSTLRPVANFSHEKASELGIDTSKLKNYGFRYNADWGYVDRYQIVNGDTIHNREKMSLRVNEYHKPQINLNHFWDVSDKLFISNVVYASFGSGGGIGRNTGGGTSIGADGQVDFTRMYTANITNTSPELGDYESRSESYLSIRKNNHRWFGFITSADYKFNERFTASLGIDGRTYTGYHYEEVYDLLGGDYARDLNFTRDVNTVDLMNSNQGNYNVDPKTNKLRVGDKFNYNYDGYSRWLGSFGQLEFKSNLVSAFISGSVSHTNYKRVDYFRPKTLTIGDTAIAMPKGKEITIDGKTYNWDSPEAKLVETDWYGIPGFTIKGGLNYNLTEHNNIFFNIGYINKPQFFNGFFSTSTGLPFKNVKNEKIFSKEIGYGIKTEGFGVSLNAYHTDYLDRSTLYTNTETNETLNVPGLDARHVGIELDLAQSLTPELEMNAAISIGDWIWKSSTTFEKVEADGSSTSMVTIDPTGMHVGGSAQNQFMIGARYSPFKGFYVRPTFFYFTKHYIPFDPNTMEVAQNSASRIPQDTYRLPSSTNTNLDLGYSFMLHKDVGAKINGSIINVMDQYYISDVFAVNPGTYDIGTMNVFYNRGRSYSVSFIIDF